MYGAIKGHRWVMLPWIVCTFAFLLAYLAGMCLSLWLVGLKVISLLLFFAALVEIVIGFYLWLCVISLFQVKIRDPDMAKIPSHNSELFSDKVRVSPRFLDI